MNRRLVLAGIVVGLFVVTAGCSSIPFLGSGSFSDEQLDKEPPGGDYAWNETDARVTIWVRGDTFKAIYKMNGTSELKLFRKDFERKRPLGIRAVRFRYPNGTVVTGSAISIRKGDKNAVINVPDANGSVAVTAGAGNKRFSLPTYVDGSYEVILPAGMRTGMFIFGDVSPGGYTRTIDEDGRVHVRWTDVKGHITIRYYLQRDIYLFAGAAALILLVGGSGAFYYYRQIQSLQEEREELGLDVDTDPDEFDDDPPPGLR
jgi:hypothetical protein